MKRHLGIVLMLILATAAGAATQDIASATAKVPKGTGHVAKKTGEMTAHGAETGAKKSGEITGHAVVGTSKGIKKGANRLGHGIKKATTTTADTSK
jgi:hypothetical protein